MELYWLTLARPLARGASVANISVTVLPCAAAPSPNEVSNQLVPANAVGDGKGEPATRFPLTVGSEAL